jgi:hypothetical protein
MNQSTHASSTWAVFFTSSTASCDCHPHEVGPHAAHGWIVRIGLVERGQVTDHRIDRPPAAGRVGGRKRREQQVGDGNGIAQRERLTAHGLDQHQRDAPAEAGLLVAQGEHERAEDQPNGAVGKTRKRPGKGRPGRIKARLGELVRAEENPLGKHGHQRDTDEADRAARQRLEHEADDHANEYSEEVPRMLRKPFGRGYQGDDDGDRDRSYCFPVHVFLPIANNVRSRS